jgi:hypothetical protein
VASGRPLLATWMTLMSWARMSKTFSSRMSCAGL